MRIIPVGCADRLHRELIDYLLQEHPEMLLIDIRLVPNAVVAPGWNLTALQERYGQRYQWFGPTLGDRAHHTNRPFDIVDLNAGLAKLEALLWQSHTLLLMCECMRYQECHRRLLVARLAEEWSEFEAVLPEHIQGQRIRLEQFRQDRQALEEQLNAQKPTLLQHWSAEDYEKGLFGEDIE